MEQPLSFTRDQIVAVLKNWISFFESEECKNGLLDCDKNEAKMELYMDKSQKSIFEKHGVNPERGMDDIKHIKTVFQNDSEVMQLLMQAAAKEESAMDAAAGITPELFVKQLVSMPIEQFLSEVEKLQNTPLSPTQAQAIQFAMNVQMGRLPPERRQEIMMKMTKSLSAEQVQKVRLQIAQMQEKLPQMPPQQQEFIQNQINQLQVMLQQAQTTTPPPTVTTSTTTNSTTAPRPVSLVPPPQSTMMRPPLNKN